jgi:hypothetical protein
MQSSSEAILPDPNLDVLPPPGLCRRTDTYLPMFTSVINPLFMSDMILEDASCRVNP